MLDGTSYWVESLEEQQQPALTPDEARRQLEVELASLKTQLAEAHKELAAKAVQLSKRDAADKAAQERWAEQRAVELAAAAAAPKDQRIAALEQSVVQLEMALAQHTEELEESRRLYSSQKRALKDALSAAAERDAAEVAAGEAGLEAATAAAEEEVERLAQELAQHKTRSALELQTKQVELQQLRQQLAGHQEQTRAAVAAAEGAAAAAAEERLAAAEAAAQAQVQELQGEVNRLRSSAQAYLREEREDMAGNLAAINKQKVQLQREFDGFKDLTAQTHRQHREEHARLLEENTALKARIAAEAARIAMGAPPGSGGGVGPKTFASLAAGGADGLSGAVEGWFSKLERQRRGLVPVMAIASLVLLVLMISVVRAAASARGEQQGAVCFLSKLGIQIGEGCRTGGSSSGIRAGDAAAAKAAVKQALGELVEATPRIRDIEPGGGGGGDATTIPVVVAAAAAGGGGANGAGSSKEQSGEAGGSGGSGGSSNKGGGSSNKGGRSARRRLAVWQA